MPGQDVSGFDGLDAFEAGFLVGTLVTSGSFGGDGRQAAITVRMHTRHEALLRMLVRMVPGSRLYGPYVHSGRSYFQWIARGPALKKLVPLLDGRITPAVDAHAAERYREMKRSYGL